MALRHLEPMGNPLDLEPMGNPLDLEPMGNRLHQHILEIDRGQDLYMVEITDREEDLHMVEITSMGVLVSILAQVKDNKGTGRVGSKSMMQASPKHKALVALLEV